MLNATSPAHTSSAPLSDAAIDTLFRLSKLALSAGGGTDHHELMAQIVAADTNR